MVVAANAAHRAVNSKACQLAAHISRVVHAVVLACTIESQLPGWCRSGGQTRTEQLGVQRHPPSDAPASLVQCASQPGPRGRCSTLNLPDTLMPRNLASCLQANKSMAYRHAARAHTMCSLPCPDVPRWCSHRCIAFKKRGTGASACSASYTSSCLRVISCRSTRSAGHSSLAGGGRPVDNSGTVKLPLCSWPRHPHLTCW